MIDANIFPKLIEILSKDEISTMTEILWVICNLTSRGTARQIRYLVELNTIPTLCDLLTVVDREQAEIVEVTLKSLENILKLGQQNGDGNPYALNIKECGGLDNIECLISHQNENISQKAAFIVENFFAEEEDVNSIPQVVYFFK